MRHILLLIPFSFLVCFLGLAQPEPAHAALIPVDSFICKVDFTDVFGDVQSRAGEVCVPRRAAGVAQDCPSFDGCASGTLDWVARFQQPDGTAGPIFTLYYRYKTAYRTIAQPGLPSGERYQFCSGAYVGENQIPWCPGAMTWLKAVPGAGGYIEIPGAEFANHQTSEDHVGDFNGGCVLKSTALKEETVACP